MNRALRVAWPALTILVALASAIVVTVVVPGQASTLVVVRAAVLVLLVLSIAAVLGTVLTAVLDADPTVRGRLLDLASVAAAVWTVAAAVTAFLLYLGEAPALDSPAFGPGLVAFVADVEIGRTWVVAAAAAAVLTALLVAVRSRRGVGVLWLLSMLAVVPVALQSAVSGAALGDERTLVTAGFVQVVAAGTWTAVLTLRAGRIVPVAAFVAVLVGVGASASALRAEGEASPVALAGAGAIALAGIVAVIAVPSRTDLRILQLLLLGVGAGLGVAASVTRAMPDVPARATPAEILTGAPLPAPPSIGALLGSWQPDGLWLVVAVGLLGGYVAAILRSRRSWPTGRTVSWVVGLVLLVWLTSGGPAVYQHVLVAPQLARLAALLLVVPLLLAGGAPLRLLAAVLQNPPRPAVRPVPGLVLAVAAVALICGTPVLRWSVTDALGTEVVTLVLLVVGCLLVHAVGSVGGQRRSRVAVIGVLLVAEIAAGAGLAVGGSLLLSDWYGAMGWGTDALAAQRSAAAVVLPITVVPTLVLLVSALRRSSGSTAPSIASPEAVAA